MPVRRSPVQRRRGAILVEAAIVYPVFILLLIGLMTYALGVFYQHQVASLAREGARWASVRGAEYQRATGNAAATPTDVYDNAIEPMAVGLSPNNLTYTVTWSPSKEPSSTVTVTVNYDWDFAYIGNITLTSTSVQLVSF